MTEPLKEKELLLNIDMTINEICKWIQNGLKNPGSGLYPTDVIKALAELISARALITKEITDYLNQENHSLRPENE